MITHESTSWKIDGSDGKNIERQENIEKTKNEWIDWTGIVPGL